MTIERLKPSGDLLIYTIKKGYLVKRCYSGYTKKEAVALFRQYLKDYKTPSS